MARLFSPAWLVSSLSFLLLLISAVTVTANDDASSSSSTIVDLAVASDDLSTLVDLVTTADLVDTLASDGPFTVFAPSNDAFAALPDEILTFLRSNTDALTTVLLYHVVSGTVLSKDLEDGTAVETVEGREVDISTDPIMVNQSNVIAADLRAKNGVVHVIDQVLIPPGFAIPLPEEDDEEEEDEDKVEDSRDYPDKEESQDEDECKTTIVDIAVDTPILSTLVDLVTAADLVETLASKGPFTVFAPTNDAFSALPSAVLEYLSEDIDALTEVLLYHVVAGKFRSKDLEDDSQIETVNGSTFDIMTDPVTVNGVDVITPDIGVCNGVVHIIDEVLIPPGFLLPDEEEEEEEEPVKGTEESRDYPDKEDSESEDEEECDTTIVDLAVDTPFLSTLVDLVTAAELADTLASDGPFTVFAPTNDAFSALPSAVLEFLAEDTEALTEVLLYHAVTGKFLSSDLEDDSKVTTVAGGKVRIMTDPVTVNGVEVVTANIEACNGVVHVIDEVLIPPGFSLPETKESESKESESVKSKESESVESESVESESVKSEESESGESESKESESIKSKESESKESESEKSSGSSKSSSSSSESSSSKSSSSSDSSESASSGSKDEQCDPTIVDLAVDTPFLSTLVDLVIAAGLADTLATDGPFTVFAPTNDAFSALPSAVLEFLAEDADTLTEVLLYHVVAGEFLSTDLEDGSKVTTVGGSKVKIMTDPITVNGVDVIAADIEACNGVVHVIDQVLIPPGFTLPGPMPFEAAQCMRHCANLCCCLSCGGDCEQYAFELDCKCACSH